MALTLNEWRDFQAAVQRRVDSAGEWVGLFDGNYEPLCELPPLTSMSAGHAPGELSEATFVFPALTPSGEAHQVVDELFGPGFAGDEITEMVTKPASRAFFIVVQRPGGERARRTYRVVFPTMSFVENRPVTVTVDAISANVMLDWWVAPSVPVTWGHVPIQEWSEDAGGTYPDGETYRYAPVEFAQVARGYTLKGPARTRIRQLIAESLAAGYAPKTDWDDQRPHLVVQNATGGPEVLIQRRDVSVWETISAAATAAGVIVDTGFWWPGDAAVWVRFGQRTWWTDDRDRPELVTRLR